MPSDAPGILATSVAPPSPEPVKPRRLGGWLILAIVGLFAWPLQLVSVSIRVWLEIARYGLGPIAEHDPRWLALNAWDVACAAALSVLSLWTLVAFLRKRRVARKLAVAFFASTFVAGMINYVASAAVAGPGAPPPSMPRAVLSAAIAVAWIRYFQTSERVRETFVVP